MKRKLIVAMMSVAMTMSVPAMAEVPDISTLTEEELLQLQQDVISALLDLGKTATVEPGYYTVGEDLPAGKYNITLIDGASSGFGVKSSADEDYNDIGYYAVYRDDINRTYRNIELKDGNVIELDATWYITTAKDTGIVFE